MEVQDERKQNSSSSAGGIFKKLKGIKNLQIIVVIFIIAEKRLFVRHYEQRRRIWFNIRIYIYSISHNSAVYNYKWLI